MKINVKPKKAQDAYERTHAPLAFNLFHKTIVLKNANGINVQKYGLTSK